MASFYRYLNVEFVSHTDIEQPNMADADKFYEVYSPEKFKLAPREDIYLDLKFCINTPPVVEPWLNLLFKKLKYYFSFLKFLLVFMIVNASSF